jgi:hypothetical protein
VYTGRHLGITEPLTLVATDNTDDVDSAEAESDTIPDTQWLVVALDGADQRLVEDFDCRSLQLESYGACETFAYSFPDRPYTGDVWPTVATGLSPTEHGMHHRTESEWSNPLLRVAQNAANRVGIEGWLRTLTRKLVNEWTQEERSLRTTDADHLFEGPDRVVHNWPGVDRPEFLARLWAILGDVHGGTCSNEQFRALVRGECREKLAWMTELTRGPFSLVGCHIHYLDLVGHVYCSEEGACRDAYHWFDYHFEEFLSGLPAYTEVLLLSDHGVNVEWIDDSDIGNHSWRAISAATTADRPSDVYDVREWVERRIVPVETGERADIPEDQLRNLGYL